MSNLKSCGRGNAQPVVSGPVLQALAELRRATPHEVTKHLNGQFTFAQVKKALTNAKFKGLVGSSGVSQAKGKKGGSPALYWLPGDEPPEFEVEVDEEALFEPNRHHHKRPSYVSVWDYAQKVGGESYEIPSFRVASVWDLGLV